MRTDIIPDLIVYTVLGIVGFHVWSVIGAVVFMLIGYGIIEVALPGVKDEWDT